MRRGRAGPLRLDIGNHKVLLGLLPAQGDRLARRGKAFPHTPARRLPDKLLAQRGHRHRGPAQFHAIDHGDDRMLPVPHQIPVEQQAKAVIHVPTPLGGVGPTRAIRRVQRQLVNLDHHLLGVTHPARDDANATLEGRGTGILQHAGQSTWPGRTVGWRRRPVRHDKVLLRFLPAQADPLARRRKVLPDTRARYVAQKLRAQRGHRRRGPVQLDAIDERHDRMLPVPEQVPVEEQPKAVVGVPTHAAGVGPTRAIRRHQGRSRVQDDLDRLGVTHPAGDDANATLEGRGGRILHHPSDKGHGQLVQHGPRPLHGHHDWPGQDGHDRPGQDGHAEPEVLPAIAGRDLAEFHAVLPDGHADGGPTGGLHKDEARAGHADLKVILVVGRTDGAGQGRGQAEPGRLCGAPAVPVGRARRAAAVDAVLAHVGDGLAHVGDGDGDGELGGGGPSGGVDGDRIAVVPVGVGGRLVVGWAGEGEDAVGTQGKGRGVGASHGPGGGLEVGGGVLGHGRGGVLGVRDVAGAGHAGRLTTTTAIITPPRRPDAEGDGRTERGRDSIILGRVGGGHRDHGRLPRIRRAAEGEGGVRGLGERQPVRQGTAVLLCDAGRKGIPVPVGERGERVREHLPRPNDLVRDGRRGRPPVGQQSQARLIQQGLWRHRPLPVGSVEVCVLQVVEGVGRGAPRRGDGAGQGVVGED